MNLTFPQKKTKKRTESLNKQTIANFGSTNAMQGCWFTERNRSNSSWL